MTRVRYLIVILLVVIASACSDARQGQSAKSLPDNPENRTLAAKRYLEVMPPKAVLQGMANKAAASLPETDRKAFMEVMSSQGAEKAAYRILLDGLVKHFTVNELNTMVAFVESPELKSAYQKFGVYMGEAMPQIQQELKKALDDAQKQGEPKEPLKSKAPPGEPPAPKEQREPPSQK